ncbi:MAG: hypothetical protein JWP89_2366 [Schlesneria sp.]|nr:hypothetical protein [Schlesneria sp.]
MAIEDARREMTALESITSDFDERKAGEYASLVRVYVERAKEFLNRSGVPQYGSLVDVLNGGINALPDELAVRLDKWMNRQPEYSPFIRKTVKYYLLSVLNDNVDSDVYSPLIDVIRLGGDFYIENGTFFIRDAVRVPGHIG